LIRGFGDAQAGDFGHIEQLAGCSANVAPDDFADSIDAAPRPAHIAPMDKTDLSDAEWRAKLSPEQYHVLREGGTERAFTGIYWDNHDAGGYRCAGCGTLLFDSDTKYDSGSGWPSFTSPEAQDKVTLIEDRSHGMVRTEVRCANCGGHLGHVFPDGPGPEGLRYCINSASLDFDKDAGK
jgi:peptide-methionine (R)-S-oxide reductase